MKLRTLIAIFIVLFSAAVLVACSDGVGTEGSANPQSSKTAPNTPLPFYSMASATSTNRSTKKSRTLASTVTTTLPPDFFTKLPSSLPGGETFDIHTRFGFEDENDYYYYTVDDRKCANVSHDSQHAIYGSSISFACSTTLESGNPNRAECVINIQDFISPRGMKGVMWYVDFSRVDPAPDKDGPCASVVLNNNQFRSHGELPSGDEHVPGYYLQNGEWVTTTNVNACRMQLPEGFAGWVYVPLTSYNGAGELYDGDTGIGIENCFISQLRLYTDYYVYSDEKSITFDEVLFVK